VSGVNNVPDYDNPGDRFLIAHWTPLDLVVLGVMFGLAAGDLIHGKVAGAASLTIITAIFAVLFAYLNVSRGLVPTEAPEADTDA
jgi:heme/copper-type cytochrome/quinol oxidase subunit 3